MTTSHHSLEDKVKARPPGCHLVLFKLQRVYIDPLDERVRRPGSCRLCSSMGRVIICMAVSALPDTI